MPTLKDVAKRAGTSVSIVSYVLNGKKKVKDSTYGRIMEAVKEVGYVPNQLAVALKTRKTYTIGVIVPDISNQFFPEIVKGIEDKVQQKNYSIILCNTDNDAKREEKYINTLVSKEIDGIIFIGTSKVERALENKTKLPVVLVDRRTGDQYISVSTDNVKGGYLATEHLIKKGRRNIVLLTGPTYIKTFADRIAGHKKALEDYDLPYKESQIRQCEEFCTSGGYQAVQDLIVSKQNFDGIFAANDLIAFGAIRALQENQFAIPKDVSIVGYDDIFLSSIIMPALTTIHQPQYEMGEYAATLMLKIIAKKEIDDREIFLEPTLIERETT